MPLRNEDGEYINQQGQIVENPVWTYTWSDLPKIDGKTGVVIEYYADEEYIAPENKENPMLGYEYDKVVTQNGTHITLTNKIADKRVKVRKEWKDDENEIENRPKQVVFILYANGTEYKDHNGKNKKVTLSDENNWEGEFHHVPEYYYHKNITGEGKWEKVEYSVVEETSRSSGGLSINGSSSAESDSGAIDTESGGEFSDIEDESAAEDLEDVVETEENAETEDDVSGGIMEEEDESGNPENNDESVEDTGVNNGSASNNDEFVGKNDAVYDITIEKVTTPQDIKNGYIA